MNRKKKSTSLLLIAVMILNIGVTSVFAAPIIPQTEPAVTSDTSMNKYILDRTGPDYVGDLIMAQNLNKSISSQEELVRLESTGLPVSDQPSGLNGLKKEAYESSDTDFFCGSMYMDQPNLDDTDILDKQSTFANKKMVYQIGDTKQFVSEQYVNTTAQAFTGEVVYTTDNCTIWRDKAHPEQLSEAQAKEFGDLFESKCALIVDTFGGSYDADNDGKTAIVFYPMAQEQQIVWGGFFYSKDLFTKEEVDWANGNAMDMLNINTIRLNDGKNMDFIKATLFHEYQHLINYSQTGGYFDTWLNESFSMSAISIAGLSNNDSIYQVKKMFDSLADKGYTSPFIFKDYYVPNQDSDAVLPYAQWFLFGRYLSNQTKGLPGGGDEIYKTILNANVTTESDKNGTLDDLEKGLIDTGYMGVGKTVEDLDELITNYNTALIKKDPTGVYSLCSDPEHCTVVDNVDIPDVKISAMPVNKAIPGGGSAMYSYYVDKTVTPVSPAANISFAGITEEIAPIKSNVPSGPIAAGTEISLSCETHCASIYYTLDGSIPTEETGILYKEPIVIETTTKLKAIGLVTGYPYAITPSGVITFNFVTGEGPGDKYEPNDSPGESTAISFPSRLKATITNDADIDLYTFSLKNETKLSLTLTPPAGISYALTLFDENDKQLADSRIVGANQNLRYTAPAGKYFLKVTCINKITSAIEPYELNIQREYFPDEVKTLDFSEMNMVTALSDKSETTSGYAYDVGMHGGHFLMAMAYLSHWSGPQLESDDPYNDSGQGESIKYKNLSEKTKYHVQNALYLPNGEMPDFIEGVKNAVYSYGTANAYVMSANCYWTEDYKNLFVDSDYTYNNPEEDGGHIVTIVGWDDNYPKENFKGNPAKAEELFPDETISIPQPKENGAFIVRNSWGPDVGEEGYFYLSYEDNFAKANTPCVFLADEMPDNYNYQYMNDPYGSVTSFGSEGAIDATEVFENKSTNTQLLRAASFVAMSANTKYEISVTIGEKTKTVAAGTKRYAGFYTERFDKSISVPAGSKFSINVHLENTDPSQAIEIGVCKNMDGLVSGVKNIPDISFITKQGGKQDVGAAGFHTNIRAYTYDPMAVGYSECVLSAASSAQSAVHEENKPLSTELEVGMGASSIEYIGEDSKAINGAIGINISGANAAESPETSFPERYDLRETGTLTPIRNQKNLGSCWAFSAMASIENVVARNGGNAINYPKTITLSNSEQNVLLTTENPEQDVVLSAALDTDNASSGRITWSISGDVSSVKLKTNASLTTESVPVLTAVKPGTVTVTATSDADMTVTASCTVTITAQGVEKIVLNPKQFELKTGECKQMEADVSPASAMDKTIIWQSDKPEVANVDDSGKITAISAGTATITAKAGIATAQTVVTVKTLPVVNPDSNKPAPPTPPNDGDHTTTEPTISENTVPQTTAKSTQSVKTSDSTSFAYFLILGLGSLVTIGIILRKKEQHG
ncbi:MAG: C1 family peptidase [Lachnospiraceae bacterium]